MITQLTFTVNTANGIIARITVEILKAGYKPIKQTIKKQDDISTIYFDIKSNMPLTKADYAQFKKAVPAIQKIEISSNKNDKNQEVLDSISNMNQHESEVDLLEQEVLKSIAKMEKQQKNGLL